MDGMAATLAKELATLRLEEESARAVSPDGDPLTDDLAVTQLFCCELAICTTIR